VPHTAWTGKQMHEQPAAQLGLEPGRKFDQFVIASYATDEVDSLIGARVVNAEQRGQEQVLPNWWRFSGVTGAGSYCRKFRVQ